jgi:hypothetical protein
MVALRRPFIVQNLSQWESRDDREVIEQALLDDVINLVAYFREQPNDKMSTAKEARFGSHGALSVELTGKFKGRITDFSGDSKGMHPLQFISSEKGISYGEALDWARGWLGFSNDRPAPRPVLRVVEPKAEEPPEDTARYARKIWDGAKDSALGRTVMERYLREHRGITGPLPAEIRGSYTVKSTESGRYHPALVVAARDEKGDIRRIQVVYLDRETGGKAKLPDGAKSKPTFGKGASAYPTRFAARVPSARALICEGPEDAITLWSVTGYETLCALGAGNMHKPELLAGRDLTICCDNDEAGHKRTLIAARDHTARGCTVRIARPPEGVKDFNDLLKAAGEDAVRACIEAAQPWDPDAVEGERPAAAARKGAPRQTNLPPYWPGADGTKDEAIASMKDETGKWFKVASQGATAHGYMRIMRTWLHRRMDRWAERQLAEIEQERRHWMDKGGVVDEAALAAELARKVEDVGKRLLKMRAAATRKIKARTWRKFGVYPSEDGDGFRLQVRAPAGAGKTSLSIGNLTNDKRLIKYGTTWIMVPDHKLAEQVAGDFRKHGQDTKVIYGRGADHPTREGEKMCARHIMVNELSAINIGVRSAICGTCPFAVRCREDGYLSQQSDKPGVYILAHAYMPIGCSLIPSPDMMIADESHWTQFTKRAVFSPEDILAEFKFLTDADGVWKGVKRRLHEAVTAEDGSILGAVRDSLTEDDLAAAIEILKAAEAATFPAIRGSMDDFDIIDEVRKKASELERVRNLILLVEALVKELPTERKRCNSVIFNPNVKVKVVDRKSKGGHSVATLRRVSVLHTLSNGIPARTHMLLIDASADLNINRAIWGSHLKDSKTRIESNAYVTQVHSKTFSRTQALGMDGNEKTQSDASRLMDELTQVVTHLKDKHGSVVLISYKGYTDDLHNAAGLGEDDITMHFGKLRGSNAGENCPAGIIIGREQNVEEAEHAARAWHAMDEEPIFSIDSEQWGKGLYRQSRAYRMRDGTIVTANVSVHPDPRVQRFLEQMREREIEQAIARLRLIHNIEPKHIYLLTSIPVDITVDKVVSWKDLCAGGTRFERAWQANGILSGNPEHLHLMHPTIWGSVDAAAHDLKRKADELADLPGAIEVEYRITGVAGRNSHALIDGVRHADHQAALREALGEQVTIVGRDADMDEAPEWLVPAMDRAGGKTLPLVPAWLVENVGAPFTSERAAERLISAIFKTANSGPFPNKYPYREMALNLAVYKSADQRRPSKAFAVDGLPHKEIEASLSKQAKKPVTLVTHAEPTQAADVALAAPPAQSAEIISLPDAWVRLNALSARLDAVNPLKGAAAALADLSGRLEAAKPVAPATVDAVEDLSIRLALANPAPVVVTMTDAIPGFEPARVDETTAPLVGNGGCSDEAPAIVVNLGYLRNDGVWVAPGEGWVDDEFFLFRGAVQGRQRVYGPSGCPPHILAQLLGTVGAA